MVWQTGDRVRLLRTEICGTVLFPEQTRPQTMFTLVQWDDGKESWAEPESLEAIPRQCRRHSSPSTWQE